MNAPCQAGDRIRLVQMSEDPDPIPPGTTGTVEDVQRWSGGYGRPETWQITVRWDIERSLSLIWPADRFTVIESVTRSG
jgi:hypothetical protein